MRKRIALLVLTAAAALTGPLWLFLPLLVAYIVIYTGVEVLFVALLVDAYFGYGTTYVGLYTLATGVGLIAVHILRPRLFVYNR